MRSKNEGSYICSLLLFTWSLLISGDIDLQSKIASQKHQIELGSTLYNFLIHVFPGKQQS